MIALAVSTALAVRACRAFALGRASLRWTRTEGTVLQLGFDESAVYNEDGDDDVAFSVHLTYAYTVRGRRYRSERFTYRSTRGLEQRHAYTMLQGLRKGKTVDVYHDPQQPERAVVLPGTDSGNLVRLCLWGAAVCASLWWVLAA
jgi:hypothetical protein